MERIVKGIWIPIEIWQDKSISWNEKILLMEIDSFTSMKQDCFMSNEYIADLLGVTERCARKYLSHLIDSGLIKVVRFDGRKRYVESTLQFHAEWNEFHADRNDCSMQTGTNVPHINNSLINKNINTLSNKGGKNFQKPTIEEIRSYCIERHNDVDPDQFFNFYESKGWKIGKDPMKDWKASVRTWEGREKKVAPKKREPVKAESVLEHNLKVMDELFGSSLHEQAYGNNGGHGDE